MGEQVNLIRNNLERGSYSQVINTEFSELTTPSSSLPTIELPTVDEVGQEDNE